MNKREAVLKALCYNSTEFFKILGILILLSIAWHRGEDESRSALAAGKTNDSICSTSSKLKTTPWDLVALNNPPTFKWLERESRIWSLLYQGEPYQGKSSRVFAYYANPATLSGNTHRGDKSFPGVVLIHGGDRHADDVWVKFWAMRGYAAISMDLDGCGPNQKRLPDGGPPSMEYMNGQWNYHAVAKVILAHSLIRSFKEVDPERTALIGISLGGHLACLVAGLDSRFKAAVSVYGCGFLHERGFWKEWFEKLSSVQQKKWKLLYDPSNYLGSAAMPVLFVTGTNDKFYPLESYAKTYGLVKENCTLTIIPGMAHNMPIGTTKKEILLFIDYHLRDGIPLPIIKEPKVINGRVSTEVLSKTELISASLNYTTAKGPNDKRTWQNKRAKIYGNLIVADTPPKNTTIWFITVCDRRDAVVSSELVFPGI